MSSRNMLAFTFMNCLLAIGFHGMASVAHAASAGIPIFDPAESISGGYVIKIKDRDRVPRMYLPIAPSYRYYDYPYSYGRGYYPIHIPGFVYYGYPYHRYTSPRYRKYHGRCSLWHRGCVANWSHGRNRGTRGHPHRISGPCPCP